MLEWFAELVHKAGSSPPAFPLWACYVTKSCSVKCIKHFCIKATQPFFNNQSVYCHQQKMTLVYFLCHLTLAWQIRCTALWTYSFTNVFFFLETYRKSSKKIVRWLTMHISRTIWGGQSLKSISFKAIYTMANLNCLMLILLQIKPCYHPVI